MLQVSITLESTTTAVTHQKAHAAALARIPAAQTEGAIAAMEVSRDRISISFSGQENPIGALAAAINTACDWSEARRQKRLPSS